MFRKSFVSIYFLPDRILIVQLARNKKKIKIAKSIAIPEGIISENRVVNPEALAKILKSAWSKFHLKEKGVGVILSEFLIFTKYFKLPTLSLNELSEAVNWQASEYLPTDASEMVMDWKIVSQSSDGREILIVAIKSEILNGYVEACEQAGLFPLSVETPSICLLRIIRNIDGGSLTIYKGPSETILILSKDEKIIGTSVLKKSDSESVVSVSAKMLSHYKNEVDVVTILLGGEVISDVDQKGFAKLGKKVGFLEVDIQADSRVIQEYLIPLSMQLTDVSEPSDPSTLNLLPANLVDRYQFERLKLQIWGLMLTITLFVSTSFLVTLGAYLFMTQQIKEFRSETLSNRIINERRSAEKDVQEINKISADVLAIKKVSVLPQAVLNDIYRAKPTKVSIENYSLDLDKGEIVISGIAADRASLITFKEQLEANSNFSQITIPISSFEKETELTFQINFVYLPIASTLKNDIPAKKEKIEF